MKQVFICFFSLINVLCIAQEPKEIDRKINENKGTFVIREIRKKKELGRDSAEISIRFFSMFCRLIKSDSPNSVTFFLIDNQEHKTGFDGSQVIKIKNGIHSISMLRRGNDLYYANFSPIRNLNLNFKRKRSYVVDVYLSTSIMSEH